MFPKQWSKHKDFFPSIVDNVKISGYGKVTSVRVTRTTNAQVGFGQLQSNLVCK